MMKNENRKAVPDKEGDIKVLDAKEVIPTLPVAPGVYRFLDRNGKVLYIGKAKRLKTRVSSYFRKSNQAPRIRLMMDQAASVEVTVTRSEAEALLLENTLIKKLNPRFNILFRDDASYPYIVLTAGEFPRLVFRRGQLDPKASNFGPFPSVRVVKKSLQYLQKVFRLRTCEDSMFANRSRPCLLHSINLCTAPCTGEVEVKAYQEDVKLAKRFLTGQYQEVIQDLSDKMQVRAQALQFEQAAQYRDQIRQLQAVLQQQVVETYADSQADIIEVRADHQNVVVTLAMVRGGFHLGDRSYFPDYPALNRPGFAVLSEVEQDVLLSFLAQHYKTNALPKRIVVSQVPKMVLEEESDLDEALIEVLKQCTEPKNRVEKIWLNTVSQNAERSLQMRQNKALAFEQRLVRLQALMGLAEPPERIECFDISHTIGENTVASCVVCLSGVMSPKEYRRFNIENIVKGDDYAAMEQVLRRRYEKLIVGEGVLPDLIVIDGGKGQHGILRKVLEELGLSLIPSLGVAKGINRKAGLETLFLWNAPEKEVRWSADDTGFHLLQEIRDEAHRFALVGHRSRRAKKRNRSLLEDLGGIGAIRRRKLLVFFGGLEGVRSATIEDLCRVPGISKSLAKKVYDALR